MATIIATIMVIMTMTRSQIMRVECYVSRNHSFRSLKDYPSEEGTNSSVVSSGIGSVL